MNQLERYLLAAIGLVLFGAVLAAMTPGAGLGSVASGGVPPADPDLGQPFQRSLSVSIGSGRVFGADSFTVPANKRLVIEGITILGQTPAGELRGFLSTQAVSLGPTLAHHFTLSGQGTFSGLRHFTGTHALRLHAQPGSLVAASIFRNNATGPASIFVNVSGYLLNP